MRVRWILSKCPKCSTPIMHLEYMSGNTINNVQYSDQYIKAPMKIPEGVGHIGCPSCRGVFTEGDLIEVKKYPPDTYPDRNTDEDAKNAKSPLSGFETIKLVLENPSANADDKIKTANAEVYLRMFNHDIKPEEQEAERANGNYKKYTDLLIELLGKLQDNPDCVVMQAEVFRERGEFDKAIEILNSAKLPEERQRLNDAAKQIKAKAESHDAAVFETKPLQL